jgi:hypothetical protein
MRKAWRLERLSRFQWMTQAAENVGGFFGIGFHVYERESEICKRPEYFATRPLHATPKALHTIIWGIFDS